MQIFSSLQLRQAPRWALFAIVLLAGCIQHTFDPQQLNLHTVVIQTLKSTGAAAKNVDVALFDDNTTTANEIFSGNTGDSGAVSIRLEIPTFGHSYSLRIKKNDALGQLIFARTIYPLNLKCVDTLIQIVVPEADTTVQRDSVCGQDVQRTLTFFACADTEVTQAYTLTNCSNAPYVVTASKFILGSPFSVTPASATIAPGLSQQFTITYDGRGQTADASAKLTLTTTPASGNVTLILIGHLRHDCTTPTQQIVCGQNGISDVVRFGTVCQNEVTGAECVSLTNTNPSAITVSFPQAPIPFSYVVTDNAGAQHDASQPLVLKQGESVTLCFSIDPLTSGLINADLKLPMICEGNPTTFTYDIPLLAVSKICNNCLCTDYFHDPVVLATNVKTGGDTTITIEIYRNDLNCPVTIDKVALVDALSEWTLVSVTPAVPTVVPTGSPVTATLKFHATHAGANIDHLHFSILPQGATTPCTGEIMLKGTGCNAACAAVLMPPEWLPSPLPNGLDTLFFTQNGVPLVFVSTAGSSSISDEECITLKMPDTACSASTFTIVPPRSAMWSVATTPSPLVLAPGAIATVCVRFTAPVIDEVRKDFTQAGLELKYTDLLKIIDPNGCTKNVPLKAVVDTLPECKEFDLAQYGFIGSQNVVYREIYSFGGGRQDNVPAATGGAPSFGDIYLKNATLFSSVSGNTPPGFFFWKNSQTPICNNIQTVTSSLTTLGPAGLSYTSTLTLAQYDWIVVKVTAGTYAVIQVTATYLDGFNIPHAVCSVIYPFYY